MSAIASQITNLTIVYSTVYSGLDQASRPRRSWDRMLEDVQNKISARNAS